MYMLAWSLYRSSIDLTRDLGRAAAETSLKERTEVEHCSRWALLTLGLLPGAAISRRVSARHTYTQDDVTAVVACLGMMNRRSTALKCVRAT